jgi:hypothetical protein
MLVPEVPAEEVSAEELVVEEPAKPAEQRVEPAKDAVPAPVVVPVAPPPPVASVAQPLPVPQLRVKGASEAEIYAALRPRPLVFARAVWFFAVFSVTTAFRGAIGALPKAVRSVRDGLRAEWGRAMKRANGAW